MPLAQAVVGRARRAARPRTRGSSRASRSGSPLAAADEALVDERLRACRGRRRRPPRPPRACSRRRRPRAARRVAAPPASRRSYDQSIVARSVRWRGSASRPPAAGRAAAQPLEELLAARAALVRAAASSSASGRLSSRAQSSLDCSSARSPAERARPREEELDAHRLARAAARVHVLAVQRAAARGSSRARRGADSSDERCRPRVRRRPRARSCRAGGADAARRSATARLAFAPSTAHRVGRTSAGSRQRRQRHPPRPRPGSRQRPAAGLQRQPRLAGPARAGERQHPHTVARAARSTSATSCSRPTNAVAGTGRFVW